MLAGATGCSDHQSAPAVVSASGAPLSDSGAAAQRAADSVLAAADTGDRTRAVFAAQIAAFADSAAARRFGDSLATEGWTVLLRRVTGDTLPPWRVRVAPTRDRGLALAMLAGFTALGRPVSVVQDAASPSELRVAVRPVNRGTHGMRATVRWTSPADRSALLVAEDVETVGTDPLPDGFLLASERTGVVVQQDSVWDVAPDPAWRRVAFGRAFLISAAGRDSLSARDWMMAAMRMNQQDFTLVQRQAFPVSSRAPVYGLAQPVIESLEVDAEHGSALLHQTMAPIPMFGGWRVRWTDDGRTLAVGLAPEAKIADDAPPSRWMKLDPVARLVRGEFRATGTLHDLAWTQGPTIDIASRFVPTARRIAIDGGVVESRDGWIRITSPRTDGRPTVVGPGTPLAATRTGAFIAALVPVLQARPEDPLVQFVVYELAP